MGRPDFRKASHQSVIIRLFFFDNLEASIYSATHTIISTGPDEVGNDRYDLITELPPVLPPEALICLVPETIAYRIGVHNIFGKALRTPSV